MIDSKHDFRIEDRLKIQEILYKYCHAIDRVQLGTLELVFHDDASIVRGAVSITRQQFIQNVAERHPTVSVAFHMMGNILIDFIDGHRAFVESYCLALEYHDQSEKGPVDRTMRVRYGDLFELRDSQWKISQRLMVLDHEQASPVSLLASPCFYTNDSKGSRDSNDPLINMRSELIC